MCDSHLPTSLSTFSCVLPLPFISSSSLSGHQRCSRLLPALSRSVCVSVRICVSLCVTDSYRKLGWLTLIATRCSTWRYTQTYKVRQQRRLSDSARLCKESECKNLTLLFKLFSSCARFVENKQHTSEGRAVSCFSKRAVMWPQIKALIGQMLQMLFPLRNLYVC